MMLVSDSRIKFTVYFSMNFLLQRNMAPKKTWLKRVNLMLNITI